MTSANFDRGESLGMQHSVYLLGCGNHGRVLLDGLILRNINVDGIVDPKIQLPSTVRDVRVVSSSYLDTLEKSLIRLVNGLGVGGGTSPRNDLFSRYESLGFSFCGFIHPTAIISPNSYLSQDSQVLAGAVVQCNATINENSVLNTGCVVEHDCVIGKGSFIGPGAVLSGGVIAGSAAFVGAGATVLPGISLGSRCVIGAGAVVTRDVPAGVTVAGNPARELPDRS